MKLERDEQRSDRSGAVDTTSAAEAGPRTVVTDAGGRPGTTRRWPRQLAPRCHTAIEGCVPSASMLTARSPGTSAPPGRRHQTRARAGPSGRPWPHPGWCRGSEPCPRRPPRRRAPRRWVSRRCPPTGRRRSRRSCGRPRRQRHRWPRARGWARTHRGPCRPRHRTPGCPAGRCPAGCWCRPSPIGGRRCRPGRRSSRDHPCSPRCRRDRSSRGKWAERNDNPPGSRARRPRAATPCAGLPSPPPRSGHCAGGALHRTVHQGAGAEIVALARVAHRQHRRPRVRARRIDQPPAHELAVVVHPLEGVEGRPSAGVGLRQAGGGIDLPEQLAADVVAPTRHKIDRRRRRAGALGGLAAEAGEVVGGQVGRKAARAAAHTLPPVLTHPLVTQGEFGAAPRHFGDDERPGAPSTPGSKVRVCSSMKWESARKGARRSSTPAEVACSSRSGTPLALKSDSAATHALVRGLSRAAGGRASPQGPMKG
jgi:hypothetical protein